MVHSKKYRFQTMFCNFFFLLISHKLNRKHVFLELYYTIFMSFVFQSLSSLFPNSGTQSDHEKRSFTRLTFTIAYRYILPPYSFQIRVGGLYMIYGLYNTQLIWPQEKVIRFCVLAFFSIKTKDSAFPANCF